MSMLDGFLYAAEPKDHINIVMYHGFTDKDKFSGIENYHGKHLEVAKFRAQLEYLKSHCHLISLGELVDALKQKKTLPPRSVVITIDDGYRSNYTLAYPVFKEYDVPATIFLATDFIDRKDPLWVDRLEFAVNTTDVNYVELDLDGRKWDLAMSDRQGRIEADRQIKSVLKDLSYQKRNHMLGRIEGVLRTALPIHAIPAMYEAMSWDEIREMHNSGLISFGAHTCTHTILTACSDQSITEELQGSKKRIEQELQDACRLFSYPNGLAGNFDERTRRAVKEAGFCCALTTVIGTNDRHSDVYELKRLNIHNSGDLSGFIRTLSSLARMLRNMKNGNIFRA